MSAPTGLHLESLTVRRGTDVLAQLNLTIRPGEVLTLMAPSGAGKSMLLQALIGALPPGFSASGHIVLNGRKVTGLPTAARRIGLLFQDDMLFPHLSVGQNLQFGLAPGGSKAQRRSRIEQGLAAAGLSGFAARDPATLSGGQRARVALLRALLAEPQALLLDEPFARLDANLRAQIRQATFDATRNLPVILVTHDQSDAVAAGGPVLSLFGQPVSP
ncbi:ATP-binding cassette domain-containing protein [Fuscibacter oryzae]|uniref:ATP-binding cassette domain-containing protein n=1 Tax=Fuscibacter oryzae TaxID=2803939 RepID=A0A8J7MT61_9RHOB|nr:ATP-binding cassette domain-containing protein [Fuscibacter oryzae]MBL4927944.1 ATP-binding cassette domain-containing protein [Fuscibacter oryzae]